MPIYLSIIKIYIDLHFLKNLYWIILSMTDSVTKIIFYVFEVIPTWKCLIRTKNQGLFIVRKYLFYKTIISFLELCYALLALVDLKLLNLFEELTFFYIQRS